MMPSEQTIQSVFRGSIRHALGPKQIIEFEDGLLLINTSGRIAACGPYEKLKTQIPPEISIKDFGGSWIIPGFVDCHTHLPQLDCRNKKGLTLLDWLQTYIYPMEAKFSNSKMAQEVSIRFFEKLISHGITTAAIYSTIHFEATDIAFRIAEEKGIRAIVGQVLMNQNGPSELLRSTTHLLNDCEKLIHRWHRKNEKLFFAMTPRFSLTCSKDLILEAGKMAKEARCYFQTHLAETKEEVMQAQDFYHFKNYASFYEKLRCLGDHSLFAHAIYLNHEEWDLLSASKSALAHCPTSNVFLKSGTMPIADVERHQIRYGFGSDVGAGPTFSMREIADCAIQVHPEESMNDKKAFYLATLGGAEALSLDNEIGNFVEGKWADFSVFDNAQCKGLATKVFVGGQLMTRM